MSNGSRRRIAVGMIVLVACATTDDGAGETGGTSGSSGQGSTGPAPTSSATVAGTDTTGSESGTDPSTDSSGGADSSSTGAPSCPDVEFSYNVAYDPRPGNTCDAVLGSTNTCAVTQVDCGISWGCNGAFENLLPPGPIDAAGTYVGEAMFMGTPVQCTVTFTTEPHGFEFACAGRGISCTGGGF